MGLLSSNLRLPPISPSIWLSTILFLRIHLVADDGIFIGGHLNQIGSKSDIEISEAYTEVVMAAALLALQTVDIGLIAGASGLFDPSSTAN